MRQLIAQRLAALPPLEDLLTADDLEKQADAARQPLKPAAVLLLVVNHAEPAVVFTQRTAHLADHAGQIAFPGGRCESDDCDPETTALREAQEEIGLEPGRVQVLGRLPEYRTSTGYAVTPVVGWAEPPLAFTPDPHEVAEIFEVPLAFILAPANPKLHRITVQGVERQYYAFPYRDRYVWGVTAGILRNLRDVLLGTAE